MKKLLALAALGLFASNAHATFLPGQVTGWGMLGCMLTNFTGQAQILDQVQYQYTCNHGPRDPFHLYYSMMPCFGSCEIENGRSYWHNNGPFTTNCTLISASCQGWAHPAPTVVPTATPVDHAGF